MLELPYAPGGVHHAKDLRFASPVTSRFHRAFQSVVGIFTNPSAFPLICRRRPQFHSWLVAVLPVFWRTFFICFSFLSAFLFTYYLSRFSTEDGKGSSIADGIYSVIKGTDLEENLAVIGIDGAATISGINKDCIRK